VADGGRRKQVKPETKYPKDPKDPKSACEGKMGIPMRFSFTYKCVERVYPSDR
jgi:hypothetical protein